ncbi:hypothetical protein [Roseovarius aestuariivivens]|uniref:hypothetical protein n=1 Tax=Roseovarius aestuariivivens TaxID=1888910 RepID=UPI0010820A25|nr:hypothetical protein [Roseovarius aestuariivivens]
MDKFRDLLLPLRMNCRHITFRSNGLSRALHCCAKAAFFARRILSSIRPLAVFSGVIMVFADRALAEAVADATDHLIYAATCQEIRPIISNPMHEPLLDKKYADTLTSILPVFIYGYAMAKGQSFDEARFELIAMCEEDPQKVFAGFPEYAPDPEFWPENFIEIWKRAEQE